MRGYEEQGDKDELDVFTVLKKRFSKRERLGGVHISLQYNLVSAVISPNSFNSLPVPQGSRGSPSTLRTRLPKTLVRKGEVSLFLF